MSRDFCALAYVQAGFAPWHWDSRTIPEVTPYKEVGVVDMPKTKAAWREIARALPSSRGS